MRRWLLLCLLCMVVGCKTSVVEEEQTDAPLASKAPRDSDHPSYELFQGRERISGDTTGWTKAQAIQHLRWYRCKNEKTATARGYFNGEELMVHDLDTVSVLDPNQEIVSPCHCEAKIIQLETEVKQLKELLTLNHDVDNLLSGRFHLQVSAEGLNAFVIDTRTGQVWPRYQGGDVEKETFYQSKRGVSKVSVEMAVADVNETMQTETKSSTP